MTMRQPSSPDCLTMAQSSSTPIAESGTKIGPQLTDSQRSEIIAKRLNGFSPRTLALEYGVNPATIWRICKKVRDDVRVAGDAWRKAQTDDAIIAVNKGLKRDEWVKRGTLGTQVLKGLGVYAQDSGGSTVNNIFINTQDLPEDWHSQARFVNPEDAPTQDVVVRDINPITDSDTQQ